MSQNIQSQENNKNPQKSFIESNSLFTNVLTDLLEKTYQGIGFQNTKRMVPKSTHLETLYILQTFVRSAFAQKYKPHQKLKSQTDPIPAQLDNIAVQQIQIQQKLKSNITTLSAKNTISSNPRQKTQKSLRSRKFTITSNSQQKNHTNNKITNSKVSSNHHLLQKFQKLPDPPNNNNHIINDPQINKWRNDYLRQQQEQNLRRQQSQKQKLKNQLDRVKNQKVIKDMKKFTYDFEGKLFGQGNGVSQPEKLLLLQNKYGDMRKMAMKSKPVNKTTIELPKKKDQKSQRIMKQAPIFRQEAQSIIQEIQNQKGISSGVKITQNLGQNKSITKQNPLKRSYRHSLVQFKSQESRFKQYHPKTSFAKKITSSQPYISLHNDTTSINNQQTGVILYDQKNNYASSIDKKMKSKSSYSLNQSNNNKTLDYESSRLLDNSMLQSSKCSNKKRSKVEYKGLPFIKTKGYKAIDISSQKSFKIKDEPENLKSTLKNRILIKDRELFHNTLENL